VTQRERAANAQLHSFPSAQADARDGALHLQRALFAAEPFGDIAFAQALLDKCWDAGKHLRSQNGAPAHRDISSVSFARPELAEPLNGLLMR